jgi:hypothetical protein
VNDLLTALINGGDWEALWHGAMQLHYEFTKFVPKPLNDVVHEAYNCKTRDDWRDWRYKVYHAVIKLAEEQLQSGVALEYSDVNEGRVACPLCGSLGHSLWPTLGYKVPRGLEIHLEKTCDLFALIRDWGLMQVLEAERQERLEAMRKAKEENEEQKRQRREQRKKERAEAKQRAPDVAVDTVPSSEV